MTGKDLARLFDELAKSRTRAQVYIVVVGAVMTLDHTRGRSTDDVDAKLGEGRYFVREAVKRIAERHGLGDDWLNEYVVPHIPKTPDAAAPTPYKSRFLTIQGASPRHLLAMKLEAGRDRDRMDIEILLEGNGLTTAEAAEQVHRDLFPNRDLKPRTRRLLETRRPTGWFRFAGSRRGVILGVIPCRRWIPTRP